MKNGLVVYHCKRTSGENAEIETFSMPVAYRLQPNYLTIQPSSGNIYDSTFGEFKDYSQKVCANPYERWDTEINEGDRFYLDMGVPSGYASQTEPDEGWGYDANYKVVKVAKQNHTIQYALKSVVE
jgi:hypothetical protein